MEVIRGEMTGRQSLMSLVGMGSRVQVEVLMPVMSVCKSVWDTGVNLDRGWVVKGGEPGGEVGQVLEVLRLLWMVLILSWKNRRSD